MRLTPNFPPFPARKVLAHWRAAVEAARAGDAECVARLRALAPDCGPVVAYGGLLPASVLAVPAHGWINVHFSLLPAWRGAAPVQRAIRAGDAVTGVTTFRLDEGMDTGPVLAQVREPIGPQDTAGELLDRLAVLGAQLLVQTLDAIDDGTAVVTPQAGASSLAPKITVDDARVDWQADAATIDRLIRSCTPEPGAWTMLGTDRLRLGPVTLVDEAPMPPGVLALRKNAVLVGTGSAPVLLGQVQAPGRRAMSASDWARGARPAEGAVLA